jgi:hypothetical protein
MSGIRILVALDPGGRVSRLVREEVRACQASYTFPLKTDLDKEDVIKGGCDQRWM